MEYLEAKLDGTIVTIIIHHLTRRNALSRHLVDALVETLDRFAQKNARVIFMRARPGVKVWSSGFTVQILATAPAGVLLGIFGSLYPAFLAMRASPAAALDRA